MQPKYTAVILDKNSCTAAANHIPLVKFVQRGDIMASLEPNILNTVQNLKVLIFANRFVK